MFKISPSVVLTRLLSILRDARYFQIIFLSLFIAFGVYSLGWNSEVQSFAAIIITACAVQSIAILQLNLPWHSLRSALITSLGLCLLLKSSSLEVLGLAAALAIASKFLIRYNGKHIFNPANFGIVGSILITGQSWISPGQWGSNISLLLLFGGAGLMILLKISRLETGIGFLLTLLLLFIVRDVLFLGWPMEVVLHKMSSGSLLLFAFFMITDPMTIPNNKKVRIIWSMAIALIVFLLSTQYYVYTAPLWVLFFISPLTPLIDELVRGKKYRWETVGTKLKTT